MSYIRRYTTGGLAQENPSKKRNQPTGSGGLVIPSADSAAGSPLASMYRTPLVTAGENVRGVECLCDANSRGSIGVERGREMIFPSSDWSPHRVYPLVPPPISPRTGYIPAAAASLAEHCQPTVGRLLSKPGTVNSRGSGAGGGGEGSDAEDTVGSLAGPVCGTREPYLPVHVVCQLGFFVVVGFTSVCLSRRVVSEVFK
eukprot:1193149-Prorocentrum_minimum.AAC.2